MDCTDVRDRLSKAEALTGLDGHLGGCAPCRELSADSGALGRTLAAIPASASDFDVAAGFARVSRSIEVDRGLRARLASRPTWERRLLLILSLAVAPLLSLLLARPDLGLYPTGRMALVLFGLAACGLAGSWLALRPLHNPPASRALWLTLFAAGLLWPLIVAVLPVAHLEHAANLQGSGSMLLKKSAACFIFGNVFALPVLVIAWLFDRSPRPRRLSSSFFVVAVLGGIAGNLALQAHCPITEHLHLLAGHATVGPMLVAAFALARLRSPR